MLLEKFSVTNYRSIQKAHNIPIERSTVLLGQNNEGKSNLLAALTTAMNVVSELGRVPVVSGGRVRLGMRYREVYDWHRDFPIDLQDDRPDGESIFRLEFSLTEDERSEFKNEVGSYLNESLPVEVRIGPRDPKFRVIKRGPGSKSLNKKTEKIARFIGRRIEFTYIPAVRTAEESVSVVSRFVSRELARLERNEEYRSAVEKIAELQQPMLAQISDQIARALHEFLPQIRDVSVTVSQDARYRAVRRDVDVVVDDGTPTSLDRKGDGVQSLAAIGLLRGLNPSGRDAVLALEEPESHLHPSAIHRLRAVVGELSEHHQVVITTHCPLFVDRSNIEANVIVTGNKARPAKTIAEIRDLLGVRASDNLRHANVVLVVEGRSDQIVLGALLPAASQILRNALRSTSLVVDSMGGTSRIIPKLSELGNSMCNFHVVLDHDDPGRSAALLAQEASCLKAIDVSFLSCPGMRNAELEDLIDPAIYREYVRSEYGVDIDKREFRTAKRWTDRMRATFKAQGRELPSGTGRQLKAQIASLIERAPRDAILAPKRSAFDALVAALEAKIKGGASTAS